MKFRAVLVVSILVAVLGGGLPADSIPDPRSKPFGRRGLRVESILPKGFRPAVARWREQGAGRYVVRMKSPALSAHPADRGRVGRPAADLAGAVLRSQEPAIREARALGGDVLMRYQVLLNAFSASLSPRAAAALARRPDVASVEPVRIVRLENASSVPFIGAPRIWQSLRVRGRGIHVAVIDTGIDYTHRTFGGPGTPAAYAANDPRVVERGTFPTSRVVDGYDFVGETYDPGDDDPSNDTPVPDPDPLDLHGHGTHVAGTCCGSGVSGKVGRGVAPLVKIHGYKVFSTGATTNDVVIAALERAADPNQDGRTRDRVDVVNMSLGSSYGAPTDADAVAAQELMKLGVVVVAAAGNDAHQAVGGTAYITGAPSVARGVISVAASIDQAVFLSLRVNNPAGLALPDGGVMMHQDWSLPLPAGGLTNDLFDARAIDPPAHPGGVVAPADRQFCDPLAPGSLTGRVPVVFKASTGAGDCAGSTKVYNAQQAGAIAVVLQSGFGGLPFALGTEGETISIPAVMISGADGDLLLDAMSPSPPSYNAATVNATLSDQTVELEAYRDAMTDFTSEGPARITSALKPDISAPGFSISSALVGSGDSADEMSGTSMASPHVAGVAALLRDLHPGWSPARIKALIMNQARREMAYNDLSTPVSATVAGSGRVAAYQSARAMSLATPPSLSFGLRPMTEVTELHRKVTIENFDSIAHTYRVSANVGYSDFDPGLARIQVSLDGVSYGSVRTFSLPPGARRRVRVRLTLDPSLISSAEQEFGWFYFHPNVSGNIVIRQRGGWRDHFQVTWHVAPLAASADTLSTSPLDLTGGPVDLAVLGTSAAGVSHADLYLLGASDAIGSGGEEDILFVGARSFTGGSVNGSGEFLPSGTEGIFGLTWTEFLTFPGVPSPAEPIEFVVRSAGIRNVSETVEVDILIDAGADGVFASPFFGADYAVVKLAIPGAPVCVLDLSLPDPFAECTAVYFPDYSNYNTDVVGLVVDAEDIGVSNAKPLFSYVTIACTLAAAELMCDEAGGFDGSTWTSRLHTTDPAVDIHPLVCGGFWSGGACDAADPVSVTGGSAGPGDDPSILVVFPNNRVGRTVTVVHTTT